MLQATAIQQRLIDFIGNLAEETGVERREIYKMASRLEYGGLPGPNEAAEVLKKSEADRLAGRYIPIDEAIAGLERIIAKY